MDIRSLVPSFGSRPAAPPPANADPVTTLRYEMSRFFDDFFSGFGLPAPVALPLGVLPSAIMTPRIDISETDREIQVVADLPGIDEKDVEILLTDDLLTIRAEKKTEHEEKARGYRLAERASGTFSRFLRLPFTADPTQIQAAFKNGVLTITIPKPQETQEKVHRIAVKKDEAAAGNGAQNAAAA